MTDKLHYSTVTNKVASHQWISRLVATYSAAGLGYDAV
jgi:hypothetical protein